MMYVMVTMNMMMVIGRPRRWNAGGTARGEKTHVNTIGGAFVLTKKPCGSWRAQKRPRANAKHMERANPVTYASLHWSFDPRTQCFDRFIPLLQGGAKQERRFLSRPCFSVMPTNKSNHAFRPCPLLPKQPKATVFVSLDPGSAWSDMTVDGRPPIPTLRHGHCMDLAVTADRSVCPCGTDRREQGPITIVAASRSFRQQEDHDTSMTFPFNQEPQRSAGYWSFRKLRCEALAETQSSSGPCGECKADLFCRINIDWVLFRRRLVVLSS
jgi:hypothetical protein